MKKTLSIIILLLAFLAGFFIFYRGKPASAPVVEQNNQATSSQENWPPQTDEQGSVTVTVTPTDLSPQSSEWKFDVVMNTHSVELDQDLTQIAVLSDGQKEYRPIRWDGPIGGHHREGTLIFKAVNPEPEIITLKIKSIADVERDFTWQLH